MQKYSLAQTRPGRQDSSELVVDFCAFGTPYQKKTRLLMFKCASPPPAKSVRCKYVKKDGKKVCCHSGKPHVQLSGVGNKAEGFRTRQATAYPEAFAEMAVKLLTS